jgi:hypothetical protein
MSQTVSELLIGVLEQVGVKQIFGLIGDSLNPLADAVRRSRIEWVGVSVLVRSRSPRGRRRSGDEAGSRAIGRVELGYRF